MKEIVDLLQAKNLVFKSLKPKKIAIYLGIDLKSYYASVLHICKKSRILKKEALELMAFHEKLELLNDSKINKKYIFIQAPLCSKAKALMEEEGWVVWHEPIEIN